MSLPSAGYSIFAFSRFWIASATAFGGEFSLIEHSFIVSSCSKRGFQSAGAVGNAATIVGIDLGGIGGGLLLRGRAGGAGNEDGEWRWRCFA